MTEDPLSDLVALIEDLSNALEARVKADPDTEDLLLLERARKALSCGYTGWVGVEEYE